MINGVRYFLRPCRQNMLPPMNRYYDVVIDAIIIS